MTNRREFIGLSVAATLAVSTPAMAVSPVPRLPRRPIPGTDEELSVVGLGNSQAFRQGDRDTSLRLLDIYVERGGRMEPHAGFIAARVL